MGKLFVSMVVMYRTRKMQVVVEGVRETDTQQFENFSSNLFQHGRVVCLA